jgi:hypothetical protein
MLDRPIRIYRAIPLVMIFVLTSFLLLLRELLLINTRNLPFDDGLFVGRAESLIGNTEKTLGSTRGFNPLVKGQMYPFNLEIANYLNVSPVVFVYFIYLIAAVVFLLMLYSIGVKTIIFIPFALFVLLDPSPFSSQASRISRELFYATSIIFIFLLIIKLKVLIYRKNLTWSLTRIIFFGLSLGLVTFLANNTREERSWVFLILLTGLFWLIGKNLSLLKILVLIVFIASGFYILLQSSLKNYNQDIFGVSLTSTTIEGEFPKLMSNLSSITVLEEFNPYVSISEEKRMIAYEISPTFKLLKNYLEGEGKAWIQFGCENSQTCGDYANGWFHVALRVAIDDLGFWITQKAAQDFMFKVNDELESACSSGTIECTGALPLAKALGVTKVKTEQLLQSLGFLRIYIDRSIFGWNRGLGEYSPYIVMDERQWQRWNYVVKSLPVSQVEYQNQYNNRISLFNPIYQKWVLVYNGVILIGMLAMLFVFYNLIFDRKRFKKIELLLISIAVYSLFIWFTRGVLLAVNSATNFISMTENYALSGRVFLPFSLSVFFYLGVRMISDFKNEK